MTLHAEGVDFVGAQPLAEDFHLVDAAVEAAIVRVSADPHAPGAIRFSNRAARAIDAAHLHRRGRHSPGVHLDAIHECGTAIGATHICQVVPCRTVGSRENGPMEVRCVRRR